MTPTTLDDIISMVETFERHELPIKNRGTEAHGDVQGLIRRCEIQVEAIALAAFDVDDRPAAMRLLQLLGFTVSSVERHLQVAGATPGCGVRALRAASALLRLGEITGHTPRDSHDTYWLQNDAAALITFTGNALEAMLIRTFNDMHRQQSAALAALRPIATGDLPASCRTAIDAMEFAADSHDQLTMRLHTVLMRSAQPNAATQFDIAMRTIATYLCDYPIGTQLYTAPDPANMPTPMEMDLMIDSSDGPCAASIRRRLPLLMLRDRARIESTMLEPNLTARIAMMAGMDMKDLARMSDREIRDRMAEKPALRPMFAAFAHLTDSVETTASYFGALQKAMKPAEHRDTTDVNNIKTLGQPFDPYKTIPQTIEQRRVYPMARRLLAAATG